MNIRNANLEYFPFVKNEYPVNAKSNKKLGVIILAGSGNLLSSKTQIIIVIPIIDNSEKYNVDNITFK